MNWTMLLQSPEVLVFGGFAVNTAVSYLIKNAKVRHILLLVLRGVVGALEQSEPKKDATP